MSIRGGLDYIMAKQLPGGGFISYRLDESERLRKLRYQTTYVPSLIALALCDVPDTEKIKGNIIQFLMAQKSNAWSWNYWDRSFLLGKKTPYPDDLDDTFLALSALWQYDPEILNPTTMAQVTNLLFATEKTPGGPYRTWLVDDKAWRDIDIVVNSNVAYFLSLQEVTLPGLVKFVETALKDGNISSPYYPSLFPGAYFISKWYHGRFTKKLQDLITAQQIGDTWETPHRTAMALSSLLRLGYPPEKIIGARDYLLQTQAKDGSWPAGAICVGAPETIKQGAQFDGCPSLTTALCLEALVLYEQAIDQQKNQEPVKVTNPHYSAVVRDVEKVLQGLEQEDLRKNTKTVLDNLLVRDDRAVISLPWVTAQIIGFDAHDPVLHKLALANVWGWMAYMTYDDFLDNEGDPKFLPSAIVANRNLYLTLQTILPDNQEFQAEMRQTMDWLDGANAWELRHCRGVIKNGCLTIKKLPDYGDYWQLAERSLGHILAGLGVLYVAGFSRDSQEMSALRNFFRHYLIARQLNDDAHDWEEDLEKCHINAVAVCILEKWPSRQDQKNKISIDLKKDKKSLQLIMWEDVIEDVCEKIHEHTTAARNELRSLPGDSRILDKLLTPLEQAAKKALATREEAIEFIASL